jgi:hypothetical protein
MHLALDRTRPDPAGTVENDSTIHLSEQWRVNYNLLCEQWRVIHSPREEKESSIELLLMTLRFKCN